jgi:hypothetical protein
MADTPELWRFREMKVEDFQLYRADELRHLGGKRVLFDEAVERMVDYEMSLLTSPPEDDPYERLRGDIRSALRAKCERRLRAAVGGEGQ